MHDTPLSSSSDATKLYLIFYHISVYGTCDKFQLDTIEGEEPGHDRQCWACCVASIGGGDVRPSTHGTCIPAPLSAHPHTKDWVPDHATHNAQTLF